MKYILGKKIEMLQMFHDNGMMCPVTAVKVGTCYVTQIRTVAKDGYNAVQLGYDSKKNVSQALRGHYKNAHTFADKKGFKYLKEVRTDATTVDIGDVVDKASFKKGDDVSVVATSKGKGFAGVVKRHHFHGHPTSHGHKDQERMPGSIGAGGVQRVFKGKRMAGRMGSDRCTIKGLSIVAVDEEKDIWYIKGSVPGARNALIMIQSEGEMVYSKAIAKNEEEVAREDSEENPPIASEDEPQETVNVDEGTGEVKL